MRMIFVSPLPHILSQMIGMLNYLSQRSAYLIEWQWWLHWDVWTFFKTQVKLNSTVAQGGGPQKKRDKSSNRAGSAAAPRAPLSLFVASSPPPPPRAVAAALSTTLTAASAAAVEAAEDGASIPGLTVRLRMRQQRRQWRKIQVARLK